MQKPLTIGSLFTGYGGLDLGTQAAIPNTETLWHAEIEPGPLAILNHHYPHIPNLGDVTQTDWDTTPPVDILIGGSPCQDLSIAGHRQGMNPGTRSGLWEAMWHATNTIKPQLVIWENVGGAYSADAFCNLEPEPGCMGDGSVQPPLRALGRVLGDLATIGYDAAWASIRASTVGAPHGRRRVFLIAYPQGTVDNMRGWVKQPRRQINNGPYLPTPQARDAKGIPSDGYNLASLPRTVMLLPTPTNRDHKDHEIRREPHRPNSTDTLSRALTQYDQYTPAIQKWEQTLKRKAPPPTTPSPRSGKPQVNVAFIEWMMGLPEGYVTNIPISRSQQIQALGNGVVPQQAEHAIRTLITTTERNTK